jgi:hypothetical protein
MKKSALFCLLAATALSAHGREANVNGEESRDAGDRVSSTRVVTAAINGTIGFASATFPVNQSAGSVIITVARATAKRGAMSVTYSTANGSALAGTNYTATSGTLKWANGDGSSKTFTVPVSSTNLFTGTKTFVVKLVAGANTLLGSQTSATVTITGGSKPVTAPSTPSYITFADNLPASGSHGTDVVPSDGGLEDTSHPTHVIGTGTAASCTSAAVVAAVKAGGIITFECGSAPVTIQMSATAQLFNNGATKTVIDGGGLVTLSGMQQRRILYMDTCDQNLVWTTSHCDNQQYPQLTVQNLTFTGGNASKETVPSGGAIYASGGRLKVVNSRFFSNVCASTGTDTAGGGIYALEQYQALPVYVVHSTFGGASTTSNSCSNGAAVGSIGVSWSVYNSVLSYNRASGNGGTSAPGGGGGGAIYNDGNTMTLTISGSTLQYNQVNSYGSGILFVSDDATGNIAITDSTITGNIGGTWYPQYPQISAPAGTPIAVKNSTISN